MESQVSIDKLQVATTSVKGDETVNNGLRKQGPYFLSEESTRSDTDLTLALWVQPAGITLPLGLPD